MQIQEVPGGHQKSCFVNQAPITLLPTTAEDSLHNMLKRWGVEEIQMAPKLSRDAHKYEAHYAATYGRIHDGKFLPLNCSPSTLGESTDQPTRLAIEAQLSRNE
ncbi:unnamed protein product [Hermetia illucens]|uniref:Uncharacterized protein n=1 Tax=Hermetia illucens TaxID=343691 RepID=A0A7R8V3P7_HERIL|nr:unnamed protein product [Hermetia illucens]